MVDQPLVLVPGPAMQDGPLRWLHRAHTIGDLRARQRLRMDTRLTASGRLAALSVVVAIGAVAAYVLNLRVPVVRNHPEGYVVAFALATALAALAVARLAGARALEPPARRRRLVRLRRRASAGQPDGAAGGRAAARLHAARRGWPAGLARELPRPEAGRAALLPRLLVTVLHGGAPRAWSSAALWPGAPGRGAERAGRAAPRDGRAGSRRWGSSLRAPPPPRSAVEPSPPTRR